MFPHEGKLVTVHELSFTWKDHLESNESIVPLIDETKPTNESLGVVKYASFMVTFDIPAPINSIGFMSAGNSITVVVDRIDPWVLPSLGKGLMGVSTSSASLI